MPESTIYPQEIEIDTIKNGVARLLCHWGIKSIPRDNAAVYVYVYDEAVIKWTLPDVYTSGGQTVTISTRSDVDAYIKANTVEIMSFAKATKLTM